MNKILNRTLLCAVLCFSASVANAKDGFYVAAQGGYSWIQTPEIRDHRASGNNLRDTNRGNYAWGVNSGYEKAIADNLSAGLELAYNDDGHSTITYASGSRYNISSNDIDLLLTTKYKIASSPFYVGAKVGVASVHQRYQIAKRTGVGTPDPTTSTYGYRPAAGLVAGYNINQNFDLYLGYKHIFARDLDRTSEVFHKTPADPDSTDIYRGIATVDNINLGLAYHF